MSDIGSRPGRTVRVDEPVPADRPRGAHEVGHAGPVDATQPMAATADPAFADPPPADPAYAQPVESGSPFTPYAAAEPGQVDDHGQRREHHNPVDEAVATLKREDNRIKLLIAIAVMSGLAMLFALVAMIAALDDGGAEGEPILVDGIPCLIGESAGGDDNAVLYCQR